jgi:hypothetical protein
MFRLLEGDRIDSRLPFKIFATLPLEKKSSGLLRSTALRLRLRYVEISERCIKKFDAIYNYALRSKKSNPK